MTYWMRFPQWIKHGLALIRIACIGIARAKRSEAVIPTVDNIDSYDRH